MINKYLWLTMILAFLQIFFIHSLSDSMQFFCWNFYLLFQALLLSLAVNKAISYKMQKSKALSFVVILICAYNLIDFLFEWTVVDSEMYSVVVVVCSLFLFCILIPVSVIIIAKSFIPISDLYIKSCSYLIYKKPLNWSGLFGLLFKAPYGHCALVTKNKIFRFKKGRIVEESYVEQKDYLHIKILPVTLCNARKLLGTQWSLLDNCFTVFKEFNKK